MRRFTVEEKLAIVNDYKDRSIKVRDICYKYKLSGTVLNTILNEYHVENRCPKMTGPRNKLGTVKKCSECYRKIDLKGARFCPYCGADIRSEKDILLEKTNTLFSKMIALPAADRDYAHSTINEICEYIKRH